MLDQQCPHDVKPGILQMALVAHLHLEDPDAAADILGQHMKLAQSWTDAEQNQVYQAALNLLRSQPTTAAAAFGSTICQDAFARNCGNAPMQHSQLVEACLAAGMLEYAVEVRQSMSPCHTVYCTWPCCC